MKHLYPSRLLSVALPVWLSACLVSTEEESSDDDLGFDWENEDDGIDVDLPGGGGDDGNSDDADDDGDGLTNGEEAELGTDPEDEDTDGDGLSDGEEVHDHDSNPLEVDTDGDGYEDAWEVAEGTDPSDASSLVYVGGWPYNPDKSGPDIDDASTDIDDVFAQISLLDQFGDQVDIHDFTGQGKPIAIDISAVWCGPCNGLAEWISGQGDTYGFGSYWSSVDDKVQDGEIYWVTIMGQDNYGDVPDLGVLEDWYEDYPEDKIPVLADVASNAVTNTYLEGGWPTVYLLDEDGVIVSKPNNANYYAALDAIDAL